MGSSTLLGVLVTTVLVLLCGTAVAVFDGYDGMPRPGGMDKDPTTTYGAKPAVQYKNKAAKCTWYGWENVNYPPDGSHGTNNCSTALWASLGAAKPADLAGFMYYVPLGDPFFYDPSYDEYFCAIGCFDLAASTSSPSPVRAKAPPPPATLFQPPPPALLFPPSPGPAMPPAESPLSPEYSPVSSPAFSPVYSPVFSPGSTPGDSAPGTSPSGPVSVQTGSGTTTFISTLFTFMLPSLLLFLGFLV